MRDGSACPHGLCDSESMCRSCRVFGYGHFPELSDRLGFLQGFLGKHEPLRHDVVLELRAALTLARVELARRRGITD